ncbi:L-seryl-tRNA(Sec) selenium transferase [[Pasteurella] aerogenes]|nr:L-seryl-tRNA(Sec) selenium transferase [[Pasteurella] aerogenes]MCI7719418.1 L-seryl-tRNA(Sec) selenium transferase [[Pasteurella] aerogenes]MCU9999280.1 L-seryl-tRNA(Sec) selenium transferase [[Pasteurella] aerogenes]MDY2796458.1 L-seryl-tRNA(Sec) selenium transferase [[Pasteurella] aerogenes]MDY4479463.1 L-seryl-tRNA(Sec) selenium transferase [[Pasteurella] aerogenes]
MTALFQQLPSVDKLLKTPEGENFVAEFGHSAVVKVIRQLLQQARAQIKQQNKLPHFWTDFGLTISEIQHHLSLQQQVKIQSVHNLTGTVLHTNLGRALWSNAAQQAGLNAMRQNVALEYDLNEGKRGHRDNYISELLQELTGAEAACVVNNNAAAVLLMLATFAKGKEVIISRGELIEIGGAFRIPDIMQQAGCHLVEVGTTNRTHLSDYRHAINENTAFLMKVHSSNYQICGFTGSVSEQELVTLGKEFNLPVITDLGSGALVDLAQYGLPSEPTVQEKWQQGVDLISFSGDKLLGGVQAGIIVGKKEWITQLQAHPLKRVLRCDKVILAGLEATLRLYLQPEKLSQQLTTLNLLTRPLAQLTQQAEQLKAQLEKILAEDYFIQIETSSAQIGSGSQPLAEIPSVAVTLQAKTSGNLTALLTRFKTLPQPIIGRVEQQRIWLDLRSVADFGALQTTLEAL